jgi:UDP-glucose 4-epimerase
VFDDHDIDSVVHFAGLKSVGESVQNPLGYYRTNYGATLSLLTEMAAHDVRDLVFSSSATVYGIPETVPIGEDAPLGAINPYGATKLGIERMLEDIASTGQWRIALLRYFNPVGAHPSGEIGEDPAGIPNNLMPFIMQVAVGLRDHLNVFGDDYDTPDGTAIRDYIHVMDLADGHLAALDGLSVGARAFNLGTGSGSSVLEVLAAASAAVGADIDHVVAPRRAGDAPCVYADVSRARDELGFVTTRGLEQMCADHWRWQSLHPHGFGGRAVDKGG